MDCFAALAMTRIRPAESGPDDPLEAVFERAALDMEHQQRLAGPQVAPRHHGQRLGIGDVFLDEDAGGQRLAFEILEHEVRHAVLVADVVLVRISIMLFGDISG